MVKLNVTLKNGKYTVTDSKDRLIYNVKTGMGGKTHLLDASGYKLFHFVPEKKSKKPAFMVYRDSKEVFSAVCTSMFLEPSFALQGEFRGEKIDFNVVSEDRREFKIMRGDKQVGSVSSEEDKKEMKYSIETEEKYFDDYIPLIAVFIDMAFAKINKG